MTDRTPTALTIRVGSTPPVEIEITVGDDRAIDVDTIARLIREVIHEDEIGDGDNDIPYDEYVDVDDDDDKPCDCPPGTCEADEAEAYRQRLNDMIKVMTLDVPAGIQPGRYRQEMTRKALRNFVRDQVGCTDPDCDVCQLMGLI